MRQYNDYENAVFGYLRNYNKLKARVDTLGMEIEDLKAEIESFGGPKSPSLNPYSGGGNVAEELNGVEREAVRLIGMKNDLSTLEQDRRNIKRRLDQIDRALQSLDGTAEKIVRLKFIDGYRWGQVGSEMNFGERNCQKIGMKAVKDITSIIFGNRAEQTRLNFVFLENCG